MGPHTYIRTLLWTLAAHLINCEDITRLDFNQSVYLPLSRSSTMEKSINELQPESRGIPLKCRRDYCKHEESVDIFKGALSWEVTPVASRRLQRCPYAFEEDWRIAYFECLPGREDKTSVWLNLNMSLCPDTPLTEALRDVYGENNILDVSETTAVPPLAKTGLENNTLKTLDLMKSAHFLDRTMKKHKNIQMLAIEWFQIYKLMLRSPIRSSTPMDKMDLYAVYSIWDALMGNAKVVGSNLNVTSNYTDLPNVYTEVNVRSSYLGQLTSLPVSLCFEWSSVEALEWSHDQGVPRDINLRMMFLTSPELTTDVKVKLPQDCRECHLAVVAVKEQKIVRNQLSFDAPSATVDGVQSQKMETTSKKRFFQHGVVIFTEVHDLNGTDLSSGGLSIEVKLPTVDIPPNADKSVVLCGYADFKKLETSDLENLEYLSLSEKYSPYYCITKPEKNSKHVTCVCEVSATTAALVTLFFAIDENYIPPDLTNNPSDVGVFLRFPYVYELTVTGYVLKGISTICLLLTLLSYAMFRKAHRGVLTAILLHLVTAMLCVNFIFFISIFMTDTYLGCQIANALRLYFVLVSLMWNGVEAVNMYLLLIQVFNATIERFIWKASVVAWGVPVVPVALSLIVNRHSFDGEWINCNFTCSLPPFTLYFAFLLPLAIIMIFNLTVFALVLKVILSRQEPVAMKGTGSRKIVQLSGAVAMLVLLGVPWIFGVFGVIDDGSSEKLALTQLIFHIIFILGLNLQGVFILWFHCLRLKEVSSSWKMKLHMVSLALRSFKSQDGSSSSGTSLRQPTASSSM